MSEDTAPPEERVQETEKPKATPEQRARWKETAARKTRIKARGGAEKALHEPSKGMTDQFHAYVLMGLSVAYPSIPDRYKPTPDEVEAISRPAERIILRRLPATDRELTPDQKDLMTLAAALGGYSFRVVLTAPKLAAPTPTRARAAGSTPPPSTSPPKDINGARYADVGENFGDPRVADVVLNTGTPEEMMSALHAATFRDDVEGAYSDDDA